MFAAWHFLTIILLSSARAAPETLLADALDTKVTATDMERKTPSYREDSKPGNNDSPAADEYRKIVRAQCPHKLAAMITRTHWSTDPKTIKNSDYKSYTLLDKLGYFTPWFVPDGTCALVDQSAVKGLEPPTVKSKPNVQYPKPGECQANVKCPKPGAWKGSVVATRTLNYLFGIPKPAALTKQSRPVTEADLKSGWTGMYTIEQSIRGDMRQLSDFTEEVGPESLQLMAQPNKFMTPKACVRQCTTRGFKYAGLTPHLNSGSQRFLIRCFCTQQIGQLSKRAKYGYLEDSKTLKECQPNYGGKEDCPATANQKRHNKYPHYMARYDKLYGYKAKKVFARMYAKGGGDQGFMQKHKTIQGSEATFQFGNFVELIRYDSRVSTWLHICGNGGNKKSCPKPARAPPCAIRAIDEISCYNKNGKRSGLYYDTRYQSPDLLYRARTGSTRPACRYRFSQKSLKQAPWLSSGLLSVAKSPSPVAKGGISVWQTPLPFSSIAADRSSITRACDLSTAQLECKGDLSLLIVEAKYGRTGKANQLGFLCGGYSECVKSSTLAGPDLEKLELRCNKFQKCTLAVSPKLVSAKGSAGHCPSGSNYLEIKYQCKKAKPKDPVTGAGKAPLSAKVAKKLKTFGGTTPYWAAKFATSPVSTGISLPRAELLNPIQVPDAKTLMAMGTNALKFCRSKGKGLVAENDGTGTDPTAPSLRCAPEPKKMIGIKGEVRPCLHRVRGHNKMINICGQQRIIQCKGTGVGQDCTRAIDSDLKTGVLVPAGSSVVVQFEADYRFTALKLYYVPDRIEQTQKKNMFTASVQCRLTTGKWKTVGKIEKHTKVHAGVDYGKGFFPYNDAAGWSSVVFTKGCDSTTWKLADIKPVLANSAEVMISEMEFFGAIYKGVSDILPISNDPCSGFAMTVDTKAKPRPVITTVWPANQAKCSQKQSKELGRDLGSSSGVLSQGSLQCAQKSCCDRSAALQKCGFSFEGAKPTNHVSANARSGAGSSRGQRKCRALSPDRTAAMSKCNFDHRLLGSGQQVKNLAHKSASAPPSYDATCTGIITHQLMGEPRCNKLSDLDGNTGAAFSTRGQTKPSVVVDFAAPAQFTGVWHYVHPQLHRKRQLKQLSVYCSHGAKATQVASLSLPHNMQDGWNFLPFDRQCPEKSKRWQFKNMAAEAPVFYVMDLLLGSNAKEKALLPSPASSKVNGWCVTQQTVPLNRPGWHALSWEIDRWQKVLSFKPQTEQIPAGSTLLVQTMFDEARVDWSRTNAINTLGNPIAKSDLPYCEMQILRNRSPTLYVSNKFALFDKSFMAATRAGNEMYSMQTTSRNYSPGGKSESIAGFVSPYNLKGVCRPFFKYPKTIRLPPNWKNGYFRQLRKPRKPGQSEYVFHLGCSDPKARYSMAYAGPQLAEACRWRDTTDTCGAKVNTIPAKAKTIQSQQCTACSTLALPSRLGEYQSGENLTVVMTVPEQDTRFVPGGNSCQDETSLTCRGGSPNHRCTKKEIRCAIKGNMHLTYWFKPPNNGPCSDSGLYKTPARNPTHAPTNAPSTTANPTHAPTNAPSTTANPTHAPTNAPSTNHKNDYGIYDYDNEYDRSRVVDKLSQTSAKSASETKEPNAVQTKLTPS